MSRGQVRRLLLAVAMIASGMTASIHGATTVATTGLTAGWATFGVTAPIGAAAAGLTVGALTTQTDVKTRWPDGSIRFAIVTAKVTSSGTFSVGPASLASGTFSPRVPSASVTLTIGGVRYSANLPAIPSTDVWLKGPNAMEWRSVVTPTSQALGAHPFLRAYFDTRVYSDGQARIDIAVENGIDTAASTKVSYDVAVLVNGSTVFSQSAVTHYWLSRWHKVFGVNLAASTVTDDMAALQYANILPTYLPIVADIVDSPTGSMFGLLQPGDLHIPMNDHGGRPEIGPYPAWIARYAVHRSQTEKAYMLAQADQGASWPIHIREAGGSLVSIDLRPKFFMGAAGAPPEDGPRGDLQNGSLLYTWIPDLAHQPSLAVIPYLLTGDRFYMDEMRFWANSTLLRTYTDSWSNQRGGDGSQGLITVGGGAEVRGMGWGLRSLIDAGVFLPDSESTDKAYFLTKARNNLAWFDAQADAWATAYPLGFSFPHKRPEDTFAPPWRPYTWIADWEQAYVAWAIHHANQLGIDGGTRLRNRICRWIIKEFTSDAQGFDHKFGVMYLSAVGVNTVPGDYNNPLIPFTNMGQVFSATFPTPIETASLYGHSIDSGRGYTGPDTRLALVVAAESGLAGATGALDQVWNDLGVTPYVNQVSDLALRSQFAVRPASGGTSGSGPSPPSNVVILR